MKYTIFGETHGPGHRRGAGGRSLRHCAWTWTSSPQNSARRAHRTTAPCPPPGRKRIRRRCSPASLRARPPARPFAPMIRNGDTSIPRTTPSHPRRWPAPATRIYTGFVRYQGCNDYRGGGHFSGRLTAPLVAAGAVAKLILREKGVQSAAHIASIGTVQDVPIDPGTSGYGRLNRLRSKALSGSVRCPGPADAGADPRRKGPSGFHRRHH